MTFRWIPENPARWDEGKSRIVGGAPAGAFDSRYRQLSIGDRVPGEWFRVEDDRGIVGYGWLDVNWGDAEILLATDPFERGHGVGSFVLEKLADEAHARGLNYLTNVVRATHPDGERVGAWLARRGFHASEDGRLLRAVIKPKH
jgi:GNAT superfamily N-acetyltransferase